MKQFWTVLQFELSQYLKNKAFIIVTVIGVVLIGHEHPVSPKSRDFLRYRHG